MLNVFNLSSFCTPTRINRLIPIIQYDIESKLASVFKKSHVTSSLKLDVSCRTTSASCSSLPLLHFVLRLLIQEIVDLHHRLDLAFWSWKSLADRRVVEVLRRRILPVPRGVARGRRFRALGGEIGGLKRRVLLREDGEAVWWVERFIDWSVARGIGQVRSTTISTRSRGRWDSWQRNARTIVRGLFVRDA